MEILKLAFIYIQKAWHFELREVLYIQKDSVKVAYGYVTFCHHFKYLSTWVSYYLRDDYNTTKRVAAANTTMGSLGKFRDDPHVNMYLKYMVFRSIPCNLLLWGCKSWTLRQSLLNTLDVFLHHNNRQILGINVTKVRDMRINNISIRIMFYNIPCIRNQVVLQQLSYVGKIFQHKDSHVPTRLLTAWSNYPRKHGRPLLTNKMSLARKLQIIVLDVYDTGSLLRWVFHALDTGQWHNLLATLKHTTNMRPYGPPNTPDVDTDVPPYSNTESSPSPPIPPSRPPPPRYPPPRTSRDR